ncbi:hypothetical protein ACIGO8_30850 [Streptomyces sp. NPDC053493]|uniref:hypothetical protein n=1 Tax=Streptomyces sp. NPDC053493 TaxID=3365705 RepID=UPI0037D1AECF
MVGEAPAYLAELIAAKEAAEHAPAAGPASDVLAADLESLLAALTDAQSRTHLPGEARAHDDLDAFVVRIRLTYGR